MATESQEEIFTDWGMGNFVLRRAILIPHLYKNVRDLGDNEKKPCL